MMVRVSGAGGCGREENGSCQREGSSPTCGALRLKKVTIRRSPGGKGLLKTKKGGGIGGKRGFP